jgi:hypothetical protein
MPNLRLRRRHPGATATRPFIPADPASLGVALDPALAAIRSGLAAHRRRLWLRRAVRRAWTVLAVVAVAELVLAVLQRLLPLEQAPLLALALPGLGLIVLLGLVVRVRPTLGETALAVDAEGGSGDAVAWPSPAGDDGEIAVGAGFDLHDAEARFVRRQRRDALARLLAADPRLFRPRLASRPALTALIAVALVVPALLLPNPQDAVITQQRAVREEAQRQAERLDEVAKDLAAKGADSADPTGRGAQGAGRAAPDEPWRPRPEPRPAGSRGGRRPGAAGRRQRAAGSLARVALPVTLADGHGQRQGQSRRGSEAGQG